MIKKYGYARVSSESQRNNSSLDSQLELEAQGKIFNLRRGPEQVDIGPLLLEIIFMNHIKNI
jgi:hypothetical protein